MVKNGKLEQQHCCKTCKQQSIFLKWTSKQSYNSQKLFDNDIVASSKNKVTLKLNKPVYVGICI